MSREEVSADTVISHPIGSIDRLSPGARAARVDAWQRIKKSFAFVLPADDYEAAWFDRLSLLATRIRELTAQDPDVALYVMLQTATNESQVAGVIAHEIAHISQRHAADQMTKSVVANLGLGLLGAMLGSGTSAATTRIAASFVANGLFLTFSRDDEREADRVGMQIMARAGWDPRGMIELFETLRREAKRDPGSVEVFFSTHPSPADRQSRLEADVVKLRGGRRDSRQFQAVRTRLRRMAPPKPMPKQPG